MSTLEDLRAVRDLLNYPEHWTQSAMARNRCGELVDCCSPKARQWCLAGALFKVTTGEIGPALGHVSAALGGQHMVEFNDHRGRTHQEVLDVLDRAIAFAESDQ